MGENNQVSVLLFFGGKARFGTLGNVLFLGGGVFIAVHGLFEHNRALELSQTVIAHLAAHAGEGIELAGLISAGGKEAGDKFQNVFYYG